MRIGMHLSFKEGPARAKALGAKALQVFCGNPRGWQKNPLDPVFVKQFREQIAANGIDPVVVHATYLINLAARDEKFFKLSCESFAIELERARQIGAKFYVVHIGNHMGAGADEGRRRVAECINNGVICCPDCPEILVENTAGGGTSLGTTFEEVAAVMDAVKCDKLGLCFDTCHALAAGYDIRNAEGVGKTLDVIDKTIGLKRLRCLHLNDSKGELGSHLDRHEHIAQGCVGESGFRALFSDKRLWDLPAILETPRDTEDDEANDLWRAIDLAIECGALKPEEAGTRPENIGPGAVRTAKGKAAMAAKPAPKRASESKEKAKPAPKKAASKRSKK
ncbi:MAG TPA: deoxyribonuclease IV [Planctomycetota bacterium]|nr:deoxyribonuclease IV [Planctomycetota bacterium]